MEKKDYLIMIMMVLSVVLLAILFFTDNFQPKIVYAGSMCASGGDYIATVSTTSSSEEVLWILDCRSKIAGIYQYDPGSKMVELRALVRVEALDE